MSMSMEEEMSSGSTRLSMSMEEEMSSRSARLSMCTEEERSTQAGQRQGEECAPLPLLARNLQGGAGVIGKGKYKGGGREEQEQVGSGPNQVEASMEEEMSSGIARLSMCLEEEMSTPTGQGEGAGQQRQGVECAPLPLLAKNLQLGADVISKGEEVQDEGKHKEEQGTHCGPRKEECVVRGKEEQEHVHHRQDPPVPGRHYHEHPSVIISTVTKGKLHGGPSKDEYVARGSTIIRVHRPTSMGTIVKTKLCSIDTIIKTHLFPGGIIVKAWQLGADIIGKGERKGRAEAGGKGEEDQDISQLKEEQGMRGDPSTWPGAMPSSRPTCLVWAPLSRPTYSRGASL